MPKLLYRQLPEILESVFKKDSERQIFIEFLNTKTDGVSVADQIYNHVKDSYNRDEDSQNLEYKEEAIQFLLQRFKREKNGSGLSAYDTIVLDIMASLDDDLYHLVGKIKRGKISLAGLPNDFPGKRKQAEVLLRGKIAGDLNDKDLETYLLEKAYSSVLRAYAHDLFYAVNNGGQEHAKDFLMVMHLLGEIQTDEPMSILTLRSLVLESFLNGSTLDLVHIKSLRFTYPEGKRLKIIEDTREIKQQGLPGENRKYPSEEVIFERLDKLAGIFKSFGVQVNLTVIVSDSDLDYCFPTNQNIVPKDDVATARLSSEKYISFLKERHGAQGRIMSLAEFLTIHNKTGVFGEVFKDLVREGNKGGGTHITEKVLEARVDEQSIHYSQMFGSYSRNLARHTAVNQIANMLALSTVFEIFQKRPLLVIDGRGFENKLIGGFHSESVVKFFTKLKDPVEIMTQNKDN